MHGPTPTPKEQGYGVILAGIASAIVVFKAVFIWTGRPEGTLVADDAYYYFLIAQNIGSGVGSSFDGLAPTNGYHPLWMAVLVAIFKFLNGDSWIPVRAALSLSVLFDAFSGVVIYRALKHAGAQTAAFLAALFWFLSPYTVFMGLRGMEASVSTVIIVALAAYLARIYDKDHHPDLRTAAVSGLLVGLSGLARTDNLITVGLATTAVAVAVTLLRRRSISKALQWVSMTAFTSLLVVLPWMIWNQLRFGSILQVSGAAKFYTSELYGSLAWDWSTAYNAAKTLAYTVMAPLIWPSRFLAGEEFKEPALTFLVVGVLLSIVCLPAWFGRKQLLARVAQPQLATLAIFGAGYMLIHTALFGVVWRTYAIWYALPYFSFLNILIALSLMSTFQRLAFRPVVCSMVATGLILFHGALYAVFLTTGSFQPRSPELRYARIFEALNTAYPGGVTVGLFNAGAFGYAAGKFSQITIVNLDCLVNNRAFESVKEGTYLSYILGTVDVFAETPENTSTYLAQAEVDSLMRVYRKWDDYFLWSKVSPP